MQSTQNLSSYLTSLGFPPALPNTGEIQRFSRGGSSESGWYIGHEIRVNEKVVLHVSFGDWRTGEKYSWSGDDTLTKEEAKEFKKLVAQQEKRAEENKKSVQLAVKEDVAGITQSIPYTFNHSYLEKKGFPQSYISFGLWNDFMVIPAIDVETGETWGYQTISSDGAKMFKAGMRIKGCASLVLAEENPEIIFIAEGYATALSVARAVLFELKSSVYACFNAGNMPDVAEGLRKKYPKTKIVLCADNDAFTLKQGKPYNPGMEFAKKAQYTAGNAEIIYPVFKDESKKLTDWNDYHQEYGIDAICAQFKIFKREPLPVLAPLQGSPILKLSDILKDVPSLQWGKGPKGGLIEPGQDKIADAVAEHLQAHLVKKNKELFFYTGTHWRALTEDEQSAIRKTMRRVAAGGEFTWNKVMGTYNIFVDSIKESPVDMYTSHPWAVNFLNGTLHLKRRTDDINKKDLEFKPHNKHDYLINVLPYCYYPPEHPLGQEKNTEFLAMLERVCKSESEEETQERIRAIKHLFGACLAPNFPIFYFLYGSHSTGKSTVMKLLNRFIAEDNISRVEPGEFEGFNMESMAGKLVNMDTDVSLNKPIADSTIKKVIDRLPMRIRRKNQKDILAPLPAVHVFGANELPRTMDRGSGAHQRRWVLVEFNNPQIKAGGPLNLDYDIFCFNSSPQGILNFALEGLKDLCDNGGTFARPRVGVERLKEWEIEANPVAQFIEEIKHGEVLDENSIVQISPEADIERKKVWGIFKAWCNDEERRPLAKPTFFRELQKKGFKIVTVNGVRKFRGMGIGERAGASF
jgi:phage/plasmid primase-like uncharacterized protein/phage/plasmid-associated DNA primase